MSGRLRISGRHHILTHIKGSLAVDIGLAVDFGLAIILAMCHSWYAGRGSDRSFEGHPLA